MGNTADRGAGRAGGAPGLRLAHVKPHGALYNVAARDASVAEAIARAVAVLDAELTVLGLSGSRLIAAAQAAGLVAERSFADRRYQATANCFT